MPAWVLSFRPSWPHLRLNNDQPLGNVLDLGHELLKLPVHFDS